MTRRTPLYLLTISLLAACGGEAENIATTSDAIHGAQRALEGCYVPRFGYVRATGYTPTDALGRFVLVAAHRDWSTLSAAERRTTRRFLRVRASLKGTVDPTTGLAAHVTSTDRRDGLLFTANDTFVPTEVGCRLVGTQTLNFTAGTERFGALTSGTVVMTGSINGCPEDPDAGHVDFDVTPGQGTLCFSP